jgi:hypothetical protein
LDHACHQRCSAIQGESQARTARSARGQDGAGATAARVPPLSADSFRPRCCRFVHCGAVVEPGVPAEAERAGDQHLMAADRGIGADLEVGPADSA